MVSTVEILSFENDAQAFSSGSLLVFQTTNSQNIFLFFKSNCVQEPTDGKNFNFRSYLLDLGNIVTDKLREELSLVNQSILKIFHR